MFSKLKAFYYPKTNIIASENTQVVNGDRLKIDSRRRSQVRLLLLAFYFTIFLKKSISHCGTLLPPNTI